MRFFLSALIAIQLLAAPALVVQAEEDIPVGMEENIGGDASINANQTKWYYRTYNGREQMRLWSITYGKWLTDWIDC